MDLNLKDTLNAFIAGWTRWTDDYKNLETRLISTVGI